MTPLEAVGAMQEAMGDLIERHCNDRARDDYYDEHERFRGMEEILTTGPAISAQDRHALEMWVLSTEHLRMVAYHATEIGDDTEPLPPIFAEVEAMLKPKTPVLLDWDLDLDQPKATTAEAVSEWARAAGSDPHRIGKQWLLTDYDTVVQNPHYTGPAQPHPDDEPARSLVASVSYSWDDIQSWLDERGNAPDVPFAGHVWTPEQQADVMERLQEYLEMHVYESFGRKLYVEALDAEWEKIK